MALDVGAVADWNTHDLSPALIHRRACHLLTR